MGDKLYELTVEDERDLFLVKHEVKPAAYVFLAEDMHNFSLFPRMFPNIFNSLRDHMTITTKKKLIKSMNEDNLVYRTVQEDPTRESAIYKFAVAKDPEKLRLLLHAATRAENRVVLGYPSDAIYTGEEYDSEFKETVHRETLLQDIRKTGHEIPLWFAYVNFTPEQCNLVEGIISPESESVGKRYQETTRRIDPKLAERIETHFKKSLEMKTVYV